MLDDGSDVTAVASIMRGGGRVPRSELGGTSAIAELEASRLIARSGEEVWFPLALMAQWFAAESLAAGEPSGADLASVPADLELWRYPLAILAATERHSVTLGVFGPLAVAHPGFVSQVVEESIVRSPGHRGPAPPRLEAGTRIREAMAAWLGGLGSLGDTLEPRLLEDGSLPPLGIEVDGTHLLVSWYAGEARLTEDLVSLPPAMRLGEENSPQAADWPRIRYATPARQSSWALRFTFDDLRTQLQYVLNERALPIEDTLLERPRLWRAARSTLGLAETHAAPIDLSVVAASARELQQPSEKTPGGSQSTQSTCPV